MNTKVVLFLEVVFMYLFTYYANWLGQKVIKNLRVDVFQKILKFKMSFFDKNAVGRLVTRTVNDIETIASIFSQGLFMIIADILKMVTVLTVMIIINLELTLVVVSIFPFLIYATRVFQNNYKILKELNLFQSLEKPIMVGLSRKSMIYKVLNISPQEALNGTTVLNTIALEKGANILRVHDVKEAMECKKLLAKLY